MIHIKKATVKDAEHISYLGRKTFEESYGEFFENSNNLNEYLDSAFSLHKITTSLQKPENIYWIAIKEDSSVPVGYAKLKLNSPTEFIKDTNVCKLQRIYVLQGYEGKGIGSKLHECVIKKVIDNDYNYLWLSNLKIKKQAVEFYKKKGYLVAGEHYFTIGEETFGFWAMKTKLCSKPKKSKDI
ncbi:GNAT family N-acetyltransferase [Aquimarina muelleri]|uniref:N-acetyltransferase n=1 Tax=Aquimarina muelleri TaxID=279356 RepID=A0A918JQP4_9FLAO|nr:GNAT family N-acetyltransferase [Aquimarina muelleri]MCX2763484.1 GNAT family N-acetyltransferase [Aquimarina muelleri]GGX02372.1 N-acetyltransferase [Aquimarina muelleri]